VVAAGLDANRRGLMINSSRGILFSDNPAEAARTLRDEINVARALETTDAAH
jgi:orotidine-5'-phosphate decarboxylase